MLRQVLAYRPTGGAGEPHHGEIKCNNAQSPYNSYQKVAAKPITITPQFVPESRGVMEWYKWCSGTDELVQIMYRAGVCSDAAHYGMKCCGTG
eukprot:3767710-Rhodomonas_salina.1